MIKNEDNFNVTHDGTSNLVRNRSKAYGKDIEHQNRNLRVRSKKIVYGKPISVMDP